MDITITMSAADANESHLIMRAVERANHLPPGTIKSIQIVKRSVDARKRVPVVVLQLRAFTHEAPKYVYANTFNYLQLPNNAPVVVIVGAGPAGLFAALRLIEHGIKPIVIERGKDVSTRKKDIALINRNELLDEESNYCFGEGGAGTYSDGKLFTRSKKRGNNQRILEIFHLHGAQDEILYEAHAHIGTDKLPYVIRNMRNRITACGGEIHFQTKVEQLLLETYDKENSVVKGVQCSNGERFVGEAVVLATGHSARDVYNMLHRQGVTMEAKGFAMGVRIEHSQALIDKIQYHNARERVHLPAAAYALVEQVEGRGVYSFCMCPGGHVVPASTAHGECVVNGMSSSLRNSPFANSAIVVELRVEDFADSADDVMAGLRFQQSYEQLAFAHGGGNMIAPAQRVDDFVNGRRSESLPKSSYLPGLVSSPMHQWMPQCIRQRLQEGLRLFDKKMHGFITHDAIIIGVESRTSSPLRIPRNEYYMHPTVLNLYPAGEGSGYAGGITSSAVDGERIADAIADHLKNR